MRRCLAVLAALGAIACHSYDNGTGPSLLDPPANLTYQLLPSGDPAHPDGILLRWTYGNDSRLANFVVYSRSSSSGSYARRAETSSFTFHDSGDPDLQYYVTAEDGNGAESAPSNVVSVDPSNALPAPTGLVPVSLNQAIQLSWSASSRLTDPARFSYYRVYSTSYDLQQCDDSGWVLEGSTVSEDFIASGLPNGSPRCFAVSTVSTDGHESDWTETFDTPRFDARNVVVRSTQTSTSQNGFIFFSPTSNAYGLVVPGANAGVDFTVERHNDGTLWLTPARSGTLVQQIGNAPIADLTSIDIAPSSGYSATPVQAQIGFGYAFQTQLSDGAHYGGVRVTALTTGYVILDWAYQSDPGNPELLKVKKVKSGVRG